MIYVYYGLTKLSSKPVPVVSKYDLSGVVNVFSNGAALFAVELVKTVLYLVGIYFNWSSSTCRLKTPFL